MDHRPFISVDIETTGLNRDISNILQIGAVIDDGVTEDIMKLPSFKLTIWQKAFDYCEPYAISMPSNRELLEQIAKTDTKDLLAYPDAPNWSAGLVTGFSGIMAIPNAYLAFRNFAAYAAELALCWDVKKKKKRPNFQAQVAGKNPADFDLKIIKSFFERKIICLTERSIEDDGKESGKDPELFSYFHRRTLDPGCMYAKNFGESPSLDQINSLLGRKCVSHDAVEDAVDVIQAIRDSWYGDQQP